MRCWNWNKNTGGGNGGGGTNNAPTLTGFPDASTTFLFLAPNTEITIAYADLLDASDAADADNDIILFSVNEVLNGTLTKDDVEVSPGTTLGPGEEFIWVYTGENGDIDVATFTAKDRHDGESSPPVTLTLTVDFDPVESFDWLVAVDTSRAGNYSSGTTEQVSNGGNVTVLKNYGSAGNLSQGSFGLPPRLRTGEASKYLDFSDASNNPRILGCDIASESSDNMTFIAVVRSLWDDVGKNQTAGGGCVATTQGTTDGDSGRLAFSEGLSRAYGDGPVAGVDTGDNTGNGISGLGNPPIWTDKAWHVITWRRRKDYPSSGNHTYTLRIDGEFIRSYVTTTTATGLNRFNIGGPMYVAGWQGNLAIGLFIREAMSDADIDLVEGYYLANHPLIPDPAKVMVIAGDSTSMFQNCSTSTTVNEGDYIPSHNLVFQYGEYLRTNSGLAVYYNNSLGGKSIQEHEGAAELAKICALLNRATETPICVIDIGTNNIRPPNGGNESAATAYARIVSLRDAIQAGVTLPVTFFVATICDGNPDPDVYGSNFRPRRNAFNTSIIDNAVAEGWTVIDRTADPIGYDNAGADLPTKFIQDTGAGAGNEDQLHRNSLGMDQEAPIFYNTIAGVI